jgi:hypothetical protein
VKLIKRDEKHCLFLIGKREREMLFSLLQRYPMTLAGHYQKRHPSNSEDAQKNQDLLEEALAEQQQENRRHLEQMLADPGRFTENDLGFSFRLSLSEIEWLLQVLNDIRVGSWIQLGQPDPKSPAATPRLNEQTMMLAWSMEIAGLFQGSLLEATQTAS